MQAFLETHPPLNGGRRVRRVEEPGRARRGTATLFLVDGMTFGTWAALIPSFQQNFQLTAGQLSWVLFGLIAGALVSMPLAGRLIARRGSRRVAFPAALLFPASLCLLALSTSFAMLVVAAVLFGAMKGMLDVSVNAQAIAVENAVARPIMSSFQAYWSLGGLGAAFLLSLAMTRGFAATPLMLAMAGGLFLMALSAYGCLLPDGTAPRRETAGFRWPEPRLLQLGGLCFLALFSEGVLLDWSAVFATKVAHVSVAMAPAAFAVFALSMAAGRFSGDAAIARLGPLNTLRLSGGLMILGMLAVVLCQTWGAILVGFGVVGLGISNLVPVLFGAAGRVDESSAGPNLATVTTLGYLGFLSGPPVIGALASFAGFPAAFAVVILFGIVIAVLGRAAINSTPKPSL